MSGRGKTILYNIVSFCLWAAALAGSVSIAIFTTPRPFGTSFWIVWAVCLLTVVLRLPAAVHEIGHLLFGGIAGMKCAGVTLSYVRIARGRVRFEDPNFAGSAEMYPKNGRHVRGKTIAFCLGGSVFCFVVGAALLLLYFLLPYHPLTFFGAGFGLFLLYEGLIAFYPAELPAGKTDGAVLLGILRGDGDEDVMLRVLTVQGILYRGSYREIERDLLFGAPVVREDLPAYRALLLLQAGYLQEMGEDEERERVLSRLRSLEEYMTEEEKEELKKLGA